MSPVEFKKSPCRPVGFKGRGPLYRDRLTLWFFPRGVEGEVVYCLVNSSQLFPDCLRDRSLITGRGDYKTGGGHVKFYPSEKGDGKSVSHAEGGGGGGHNKFWGSFYVVA